MDNLWRDVRFGVRMLGKHKGFTAVAVLALALGIGPNTAIFSVVYATLLAPLPFPNADRLVVIWSKVKGERNMVPVPDYLEYKWQSASFESFAANSDLELNLATPEEPVQVLGQKITPGFTDMLKGWNIALGRDFLPEDAQPGKEHVVIMTHKMWAQRFQSDPQIIGKTIKLDGEPYTVVGVRKAGPPDRMQEEFNIPMVLRNGPESSQNFVVAFGRLLPGVPISRAQAELAGITKRLIRNHPKGFPKEWTVSVEPLKNDFLSPNLERHLWLLMGSVGFVLLIACANVANLLVARGTSRQKELAVRASLGASSGRLFRQFLAESLTLGLLGGAVGVGLGWAIMKGVMALLPEFSLPSEADVQLNPTVLLFTLGTSLLAGLLFGCAPAWNATRLELSETLKQAARSVMGGGKKKLQGALVAVEFALAITLLSAAGLALHSYWNLSTEDVGIRTDHVLTGYLSVPKSRFTQVAQIAPFYREMIEKVNAVPGVLNAAVTINLPLQGHDLLPFTIEGQQTSNPNAGLLADLELATPGYFPAFHVRVDRGRQFADTDNDKTEPVVMVSDDFVRRWLSNVNPLNQYLMIPSIQPLSASVIGPPVKRRIIGVFHNVKNSGNLSEQGVPQMFVPFWQSPWPQIALVVRTKNDPGALAKGISQAVHNVAPTVPLTHVQAMDQIIDSQLSPERFGTVLYGGFAFIALVLAAVGIYGVMAFAVAQRTHEIGLRMALGAGGTDVVGMILKDAMKLAGIGLVIGMGGAYLAGRLMRSALFEIGSIDAWSFVAVSLILLASALLASYIPAHRATKVDPMIALRQE